MSGGGHACQACAGSQQGAALHDTDGDVRGAARPISLWCAHLSESVADGGSLSTLHGTPRLPPAVVDVRVMGILD